MKKTYILSILLSSALLLCASLSFAKSQHQQMLQVSILKCGTNLGNKCIQLLTNRKPIYNVSSITLTEKERLSKYFLIDSEKHLNALMNLPANAFWWMHLLYDPAIATALEKNKSKLFFMYRDPRDQIISFIFYYMKIYNTTIDVHDAITDLITQGALYGERPIVNHNINELYQRYLPWMQYPGILNIRFEDLVGSRGGGSDEKQLETVHAIARHLELTRSDEELKIVAESLFGPNLSHTFRQGQIGGWKEYFTDEHKRLFKEVAGQLLIDLGYEQDLNW
ncbi:MAG TPA: sulfotransferase domain-containing protein [Candidatus Babeliales bacterium]|nr:sulfotransferase domain-containing protein [Candidatus Babeliales bacterium]